MISILREFYGIYVSFFVMLNHKSSENILGSTHQSAMNSHMREKYESLANSQRTFQTFRAGLSISI